MKEIRRNARRNFIIKSIALVAGVYTLDGCGRGKTADQEPTDNHPVITACDDLSNVSKQDIETRQKLGYVKESPIADNQCQNCNLYLPPKNGQACGGCMLFKGPVFPSSYCTYWAPKV